MTIQLAYKRPDCYIVYFMRQAGIPVYPTDDNYGEVSAYLASHPEALVPEPVPPPPTPEQIAQRRRAEAQAYLDSTDWYVIRQMERQVVIPSEIEVKRLDAIEILNA